MPSTDQPSVADDRPRSTVPANATTVAIRARPGRDTAMVTATTATDAAWIKAMPSKPALRTSRPHSQETVTPAAMTRATKVHTLTSTDPSASTAMTTADARRVVISDFLG